MRKEIVYSLAAVAAIPVVASAAESGASAKGLTIQYNHYYLHFPSNDVL